MPKLEPVRAVLPAMAAVLLSLALAPAVRAQSAADSAGVREAALDYIEGWYRGDAKRMERAVHPELVKRIYLTDPKLGVSWVEDTGAGKLVASTANGGGSGTPVGERRADVRILDIFRNAASVKVDAADWVDYLHLVRTKDGWKILNVLWELREPYRGG